MKKQDTTIKFGGRTLMFDVFINTDEDPVAVVERIREAASGPRLRMAVVAARAPITGPEAINVWRAVGEAARAREAELGITDDGEN